LLNTIAGMLSGGAAATSYESIATISVASGTSGSMQFTSIPQTYTHLQVRGIVRTNYANDTDSIYTVLNTDGAGANFYNHYLSCNGSVTQVGSNAAAIIGWRMGAGSTNTSGVFSGLVMDVLDYTNTNKYTTIRTFGGFDNNGNGTIALNSTLWKNTAAITSLYIEFGAGSAIQYSSFALYGIKGA
jgi:hypothetical protein